jgi:hypothetical protein
MNALPLLHAGGAARRRHVGSQRGVQLRSRWRCLPAPARLLSPVRDLVRGR